MKSSETSIPSRSRMAWLWLSLAIALSLLATGCSDGVLRLTFVTATPAVVAPTATPITDLNIAIDAQVVPTATAVIGPTPTVVPQGDPTPRSVVIIEAEPAPTDIPPPTLTPAPTIGIIAVVVPTPTVAPAFDPIVSVTIVPFDINVMVGMSLRLAATGANESGNEVTDATVSWSVSEDAGTVNSDGLFTASDTSGVYPDALTIDLLRKGVITRVTHTVTVNSGLVHLWSGDDDATDSVSGNNGVMNGATFAPGKVGRAFSFDGDDDYIALDQQPEIDNSFSIGGWVKFDEYRFNEGQEIFNNNQFFMRKDPDFRGHEMSLFIHLIGGGVEQRVSSITSLAPGVWYHVFGISDGSFIRIYLNGVLEAEERRGGALWPTPVEPRIGSGDGLDLSVNFFSGLIDELAIYKRALTGDEIASLFERGNSVTSTDGLVHLWSGDGNANDFVGGISGVPMNGATYAPGLFGDAFSLDGEDDFIALNRQPILPELLTISVWIRLTDGGDREPNSVFSGDAVYLVHNGFGDDNQFEFGVPGASYHSVGGATTDWTHLAAVWDGSTYRLFINGKLDSSEPARIIPGSWGVPAQIGLGDSSFPDISPFRGLIDELAIYDRALSAEEVQLLFTATTGG